MINFEIEYTTNLDDRQTEIVQAQDLTKAYLQFACDSPKHYIITNIKEI